MASGAGVLIHAVVEQQGRGRSLIRELGIAPVACLTSNAPAIAAPAAG